MKKFCNTCQTDLDISYFNKKTKSSDGYQSKCRCCSKQYQRQYYSDNAEKYKATSRRTEQTRRQNNKDLVEKVKSYYGCSYCDETEHCCLDLHHLNSNNKIAGIAFMVYKGTAIVKLEAELKKCICVCSNCHRKIHTGLIRAYKKDLVKLCRIRLMVGR